MFKNTASKFMVFAWDTTTGVAKTGDAANITAYVSKDYGAVTVLGDTSATEIDSTNAKGYYLFDAAQAETNGDCLMISAKSSTANIAVIGAPAVIYTRPTTNWLAPATLNRTLVVDAAGLADANCVKLGPTGSGTAQTARDVGASVLLSAGSGTGQLDFTSGVVKANLAQILGTALTESAGQIAAGFKQFFNIASPTSTMNLITAVTTATTATNVTTVNGLASNVITAASINAAALNGKGDWNIGKTGYSLSAAGVQAIWDALTSALTTVGSIGKLLVDNVNATISSRLASASYTAPDNTSITAIKTQTDKLTFTVANQIDANIKSVAGTTVTGSGTSGSPWGP